MGFRKILIPTPQSCPGGADNGFYAKDGGKIPFCVKFGIQLARSSIFRHQKFILAHSHIILSEKNYFNKNG